MLQWFDTNVPEGPSYTLMLRLFFGMFAVISATSHIGFQRDLRSSSVVFDGCCARADFGVTFLHSSPASTLFLGDK